ncbi:hypothetical protein [Amycolatopsis jiangsuensis]|uniref:DUF2867 domain-containing protein n=1 Tax=Amycolatopsis jiangsuensis TaxID=1181879 RepID=A0A840J5C4_9PSEU|nr:hypothetical protein [Amycolatopsis jiangsuensis]MBB4688632.1 hypothetical protein [Amycolatopsis jiangsuensis]
MAARPGVELTLSGRHHFSAYRLAFHLEPVADGRTLLRAETRAEFPGAAGAGYRMLVFGSGGHAFLMRRMLRTIAARSVR